MQKFLDWYLKFYPTSDVPIRRRIVVHAFYWLIFGILSMLAFLTNASLEQKLFITLFFIINGATIFYGITYFAIPNLITSKRFIWGILILILLYSINFIENYSFNFLAIKYSLIKKEGHYYNYAKAILNIGWRGFFSPVNIFREVYLVLNSVTIPLMLKFSRLIIKNSIRTSGLSKQKIELEIDFLRSQLNPDFLLNSLQKIHQQVDSNYEKAADSIISLSGLLKYILYQSAEKRVDLVKEVSFLKNYVDLEKLKNSETLKIQFSQKGEMEGQNIAPLILITFVKNTFKHASINEKGESIIDINIELKDEILYFNVENDYLKSEKANEIDEGILNIKKRLQLIYPDCHNLFFTEKNNKFKVELKIKLTQNEIKLENI